MRYQLHTITWVLCAMAWPTFAVEPVSNLTASGFDYAGIYNDYVEYGSMGTISNVTLTGQSADYGMYFYEVYSGSYLSIDNAQVSGFVDPEQLLIVEQPVFRRRFSLGMTIGLSRLGPDPGGRRFLSQA